MITNLERTEKYIVKWIKNYAESAGIKTLIVGLSGGIDSALVALLCKKTGLPTVCVNMPCHSSSFSYERAKNFAEEQGLNLMTVDLGSANDSILIQMGETNRVKPLTNEGMNHPVALGGLRSCLRAPVLSYFALATKGLIMGTGNRSEDNLTRYFQKFGDGCVDICPIADLFKSEVYELFAHMAKLEMAAAGNVAFYVEPPAAAAIHNATPTADLWGPDAGHEDESELGISYDEIEWADRQNMRNSIVTNNEDPVKNSAWLGYTGRQREVIGKMHAIEKATRHKYNPNLPVCEVRKADGLVQ
jgi:NAD+ synthase